MHSHVPTTLQPHLGNPTLTDRALDAIEGPIYLRAGYVVMDNKF